MTDDLDISRAPGGEDGGLGILAILEAMLFASPEPLTIEEIEAALPAVGREQIVHGLEELSRALQRPDRGLRLEKVAGGWRLVTRPELAEPLRALFRFRNQKRLTPAALDVLAIIAYAQPITAPEIQEIRGTDPSWAIRVLLERKMIRTVGRRKVVGRPILYGTTREFLLHFGLDSLDDLPPVEAYGTRVVPAQGRLFSSRELAAEGEAGNAETDPPGPASTMEDPPPPTAGGEADGPAEGLPDA